MVFADHLPGFSPEKISKTFGANAKPPYLCTPNRNKAFGFKAKGAVLRRSKFMKVNGCLKPKVL